MLFGYTECPDFLEYLPFQVFTQRTRFKFTFYIPLTRSNYAANSSVIRIIMSHVNWLNVEHFISIDHNMFKNDVNNLKLI